jgi:hypothetical protein
MHVREAVVDNGIGQALRLNYIGDIQMKIEQGNGLDATVCMDHIGWRCHNLRRVAVIDNGNGFHCQAGRWVFNICVEKCRICRGTAKVIACIEDPVVIKKILMCLEEKVLTRAVLLLPDSREPPQSGLFG